MNYTLLNQGTINECSVAISSIDGISARFVFGDFVDPEDSTTIFSYLEGMVSSMLQNYLQSYSKIKFSVRSIGEYLTSKNETTSSYISSDYVDIYRHTATREEEIRAKMFQIFHPEKFQNGELTDTDFNEEILDGDADSSIRYLVSIREFTISIMFPLEYNANSLKVPNRPIPGLEVTPYIAYLPYNTDKYCLLHTIFNRVSGRNRKTVVKSLNRDTIYMEEFTQWRKDYDLDHYYYEDNFLLDKIEELENQLQISLNLFTLIDEKVERHYQSSYKNPEMIIYLLIIPNHYFKNPNINKEITLNNLNRCNIPIKVNYDSERNFVMSGSIKEMIFDNSAHCCELKLSWFNNDGITCEYCTKPLDRRYLEANESHKKICLQSFQGVKSSDRVKNFVTAKETLKQFKNFDSLYRVPFATYDFETRIEETVENGKTIRRHIPFSYSILYLNIFDFSRSLIFMVVSEDPEDLIKKFLSDVKRIALHHHKLQSCDLADEEEKRKAKIPSDNICPWCHKHSDTFEFNHSHFSDDNLNLHLNRYICKKCNARCKIRDKPLKFFAHNSAKFDNNLFVGKLFNDPSFKNFNFVAKNESRFNQITCSANGVAIGFCDSRLILSGALADLTNAWVNKSHIPNIKILLRKFYPELGGKDLQTLAEISLKKAIFPYSALNKQEEYFDKSEPLDREIFYNELSREPISDKNYEEYLKTHQTLSEIFDDFTFSEYHNFYLLLDVVLLANVLYNSMQVNFDILNINMLSYMSLPSFSFNSLLKFNLDNKLPVIELPSVNVQLFVQRGIHGGFTFIFNKINLRGILDWTMYVDFTSMYPTAMSKYMLPYKHLKSILEPTLGDLDLALADENHYYFIDVDIAPLKPEFHKRNSILPFFPGAELIKKEYLSPDQHYRYDQNSGKNFKDCTFNTVTFFEKKGYVASSTYLREAKKLGYEVTKVNRIEKFAQGYVMKKYIDHLYEMKKELTIERDDHQQKKTSTGYDQDAHSSCLSRLSSVKLQLNAIYGFTITNVSRQNEVEILDLDNNKKIRSRISSCRFKSLLQCDDKVLISKQKSSYEMNYPLSLGTAILYESKLMMSKFVYSVYEFLEKKSTEEFPLVFHPCMTDTDSYFFSVGNFKHYWKNMDEFNFEFNNTMYKAFDTSACEDPSLKHPETHSELGYLTNETSGNEITEFYGLCSKVYSYIEKEKSASIKAKGVSKAAKQKYMSHELYESVVTGEVFKTDREKLFFDYTQIKSDKIELTNIESRKQLVTFVDTKSYYGTNSTEYLIFGSTAHLAAISENENIIEPSV